LKVLSTPRKPLQGSFDHDSPTDRAVESMRTSQDVECGVLSEEQKTGTSAFENLPGSVTST